MSTPVATQWKHLERKSGSAYRQLFVKGTRIMARVLYGLHVNEEEPMTLEEIAAAYQLPLAAVNEAIAYCQADAPEIRADMEMEEASIRDLVMQNPNYIHPSMTAPPSIA